MTINILFSVTVLVYCLHVIIVSDKDLLPLKQFMVYTLLCILAAANIGMELGEDEKQYFNYEAPQGFKWHDVSNSHNEGDVILVEKGMSIGDTVFFYKDFYILTN